MLNTGTLALTLPSDREVRMTRVFDAPRALVFDALTKPELLMRWFSGPPGWSLEVCEFDAKEGGAYRYVWRGPDGTEMGMGGVLLEFVVPERLVSTEKFDQAWYPGEATGTIVLTEEGGKTTLTLTVEYDSQETRDMVLQTPMKEGVQFGYDRLADLLAAEGSQRLEKGATEA